MAAKKKKVKASSPKNQKPLHLVLGLILIIVVLFAVKGMQHSTTSVPVMTAEKTFDFANATLTLNDQKIGFVNGTFSVNDPATGEHSARIGTRTLDSKGDKAAAIILDSPGGSGAFYYLVGSTLVDGKEKYSKPVLLGDRIKIESVTVTDPQEHDNGEITVEYLDRGPQDAMVVAPTVKMTAKYSFEDNGELIQVLQ
jgi:hypothetical protein